MSGEQIDKFETVAYLSLKDQIHTLPLLVKLTLVIVKVDSKARLSTSVFSVRR